MIAIDGFYLYSLGASIHPLSELKGDAQITDWFLPLLTGQSATETFIDNSVYEPKFSRAAGMSLLAAIKPLISDYNRTSAISIFEAYQVTSALTAFETVLTAELSQINVFMVKKKRGYDTGDLVHRGWVMFPETLATKVPESVVDMQFATRCIAFELPTAAGFHLHRANESILHRYFDAVSNGAKRPEGRNIGDYLARLRENKWGEEKVLSALKDLKDLHRNPLIHPEDSLEDVDEALALLGSIHAAVVLMLKAISEPPQVIPATGSV